LENVQSRRLTRLAQLQVVAPVKSATDCDKEPERELVSASLSFLNEISIAIVAGDQHSPLQMHIHSPSKDREEVVQQKQKQQLMIGEYYRPVFVCFLD
jgi:hypothetical protein